VTSAGKPRRALIIVQNLPVPFDRRVWLEATTLAAAGYQVSVICPKAKGFTASFEVLDDVHIYRYGLPVDAQGAAGFMVEFLWCFVRTTAKTIRVAIRGRGFDVLHICNPPETYWPLARFWKLFGKRFLFDHHDLSPEMYQAKFASSASRLTLTGLRFLERKTFETADLVVTTNQSHKRIAMQRGGVAAGDVYVVRSGPDLGRLTLYPPDTAWRKGKRHLLVYLGEICKQDGVDHLVRALQLLREELGRDDVHCVLVGGGPHQPNIKAYAEEIGVAELCTFTGRVSDDVLCRILSSADVGVDPDPKNAWSDKSTMNKIMEYMFFGLPIAAYELTENRLSAGPAALFAEPNRERALAGCIAELLDDPDRRRQMGQAGRERLRAGLAWEHSAPVLLAAYDRLWPLPRQPSAWTHRAAPSPANGSAASSDDDPVALTGRTTHR
jgi:glycosyltransferase involved in cell wall biosynthesis